MKPKDVCLAVAFVNRKQPCWALLTDSCFVLSIFISRSCVTWLWDHPNCNPLFAVRLYGLQWLCASKPSKLSQVNLAEVLMLLVTFLKRRPTSLVNHSNAICIPPNYANPQLLYIVRLSFAELSVYEFAPPLITSWFGPTLSTLCSVLAEPIYRCRLFGADPALGDESR